MISPNDTFPFSFKPYYKWNTFNTLGGFDVKDLNMVMEVLNLIINGIPSILISMKLEVPFKKF